MKLADGNATQRAVRLLVTILLRVGARMNCGMEPMAKGTWIRVSNESPCEVCGRPDFCTRSTDGTVAKCMRIESEKKATGEFGGWIHRINGKPMAAVFVAKRETVERDWSEVAQSTFDRGAAIRVELATSLGVSVLSLERLFIGAGYDDYRSLSYSTWPEKRQGGKVLGIIRRYNVPVSDGGGNKLTMNGSKHGLYLPLDWWRGEGPVIVCEGGSDTAALLTLGLSAIGRPSNVGGVNHLIGALGDCERPIIILGERDRKAERIGQTSQCKQYCQGCSWCWPGLYGAKETASRLKASMSRKRILWRLPPNGFKDAREWLNKSPEPSAAKFLNRLVSA